MGRIRGEAEQRCVELFCQVLGTKNVKRRHTFEFLRGDPSPKRPKGVMLPVDAFFPDYSLVVEYMGEQHTEEVALMNRRPGRREQRPAYQQRRTDALATKGYRLVRVWHYEVLTPRLVREKLRHVGVTPPEAPDD